MLLFNVQNHLGCIEVHFKDVVLKSNMKDISCYHFKWLSLCGTSFMAHKDDDDDDDDDDDNDKLYL